MTDIAVKTVKDQIDIYQQEMQSALKIKVSQEQQLGLSIARVERLSGAIMALEKLLPEDQSDDAK